MRRVVCTVLAVFAVMGLLAAPAGASRLSDIEREKAELRNKIRAADKQASSLTQKLAQSNSRRAQLEQEIATLSSNLRDAEARLLAAEGELGNARSQLFLVQTDLARTLGEIDDIKGRVADRSRTAYKIGGGGLYVEILLSARNVRDFFSRIEYISSVLTDEQTQIEALKELSVKLDADRGNAVLRRDDIAVKKAGIEEERANIARLKQSLATSRAAVVGEIATQQSLLAKVKADKAGYLQQMAKLEVESRSIAALLRARQRGQVFQAGSGTRLAWPTTGPLSSSYGYRTHPIFKDRRFHAGIDISAPYGQAVISAESGTVVFAGSRGGYGTTVIIDHGNALATLYAHLSSISVSSGSRIGRGQRVGSVGCSGYCTGPHLHFETRINGDPVDPMRFF